MKWFKFYGQDYLSDPKILALSACERSCWVSLLAYASSNDNAMITFLSEEQLMIQAGVSPMHEEWEQTKGVLEKFKKLKMIAFDNEMITLLNWQKRQEINLTPYERVKRYRQKKRDDNADNKNDNIRVDKIRIDKNRVDKKRRGRFIPPSPQEVTDYCLERKNGLDPNQFINFYASKGWLIGKNRMKDWRAAVRTWEGRDKGSSNKLKAPAGKYANL